MKVPFVLSLFAVLSFLSAQAVSAQDYVSDGAGVLSADARQTLDAKLAKYHNVSGIRIAVATVPTLAGAVLGDFAQRLRKEGDNDVLLLVVPPPEKQVWIATGAAIRGWLSDAACVHIIDTVTRPLNRQERRADAIVATADAIIAHVGEQSLASRGTATQDKGWSTGAIVFFVLLGISAVFLIIVFVVSLSSPGQRGSGGGGGSSFIYISSDSHSGGGSYDGGGGGWDGGGCDGGGCDGGGGGSD